MEDINDVLLKYSGKEILVVLYAYKKCGSMQHKYVIF